MADITITPANVMSEANADNQRGIAGEAIVAGEVLYKKSADKKLWKADANVSDSEAKVVGIALNGAAADQPVMYQSMGWLHLGSSMTTGEIYVLSANSGMICPEEDLITGHYVTLLGVASDGDTICLAIHPTGIQIP